MKGTPNFKKLGN